MTETFIPPPKPIVKIPSSKGERNQKIARGYSIEEIKAVGLNINEARKIGIYVDERRKSAYEENINALKKWLEKVDKNNIPPKYSTLPKIVKIKRPKGRVFRGKTRAGRKMRGLLKTSLRETHRYKWKRKYKERMLKKRHEARFAKGGD
ncbi:MAG TPA: hypothetical protein ENG40_01380 [Thermoprotei archaeon]|nr:hypothetical protein [Thermoprotei archaeon]